MRTSVGTSRPPEPGAASRCAAVSAHQRDRSAPGLGDHGPAATRAMTPLRTSRLTSSCSASGSGSSVQMHSRPSGARSRSAGWAGMASVPADSGSTGRLSSRGGSLLRSAVRAAAALPGGRQDSRGHAQPVVIRQVAVNAAVQSAEDRGRRLHGCCRRSAAHLLGRAQSAAEGGARRPGHRARMRADIAVRYFANASCNCSSVASGGTSGGAGHSSWIIPARSIADSTWVFQ